MASKVTFAKLREEPDEYPGSVEYSVTKRGLVGVSTVASSDDRPLEDRIIERLTLGPRTKSKLADELGRSRLDVDGAITTLFAAHRLTTITQKVRGRECKAFALRENDSGRTADERRPAEDGG